MTETTQITERRTALNNLDDLIKLNKKTDPRERIVLLNLGNRKEECLYDGLEFPNSHVFLTYDESNMSNTDTLGTIIKYILPDERIRFENGNVLIIGEGFCAEHYGYKERYLGHYPSKNILFDRLMNKILAAGFPAGKGFHRVESLTL